MPSWLWPNQSRCLLPLTLAYSCVSKACALTEQVASGGKRTWPRTIKPEWVLDHPRRSWALIAYARTAVELAAHSARDRSGRDFSWQRTFAVVLSAQPHNRAHRRVSVHLVRWANPSAINHDGRAIGLAMGPTLHTLVQSCPICLSQSGFGLWALDSIQLGSGSSPGLQTLFNPNSNILILVRSEAHTLYNRLPCSLPYKSDLSSPRRIPHQIWYI